MSKQITSPIERWAGTVSIADPLTLSQARLIEDGLTTPETDANGKFWTSALDIKQIPAILACVEKWELANLPDPLTLENFPASPRKDSHALVEWIFRDIMRVYSGEAEVPKE